jgi:hypothetical protein
MIIIAIMSRGVGSRILALPLPPHSAQRISARR